MDAQGFRLPQVPRFLISPNNEVIQSFQDKFTVAPRKSLPTADSRYPDYAAPMSDGRLVTDWRSRCQTTIPLTNQEAVKNWLVHNADEIMNVSRYRQVEYTGALYGTARTEMPFEQGQSCNPYGCAIQPLNDNGIGITRRETVPELFGTFSYPKPAKLLRENTQLNSKNEYGRNTTRRWANLLSKTQG